MSIYTPKRKTANGTEDVQFPISAINGLEEALISANAKISDLSGSIWKLNSKVNVQEMYYQIDFVSNGETFDQLIGSFATTGLLTTHMQYSMTGSTPTTVYTQMRLKGTWNDYNYRIIEISGGRDATNATLIDWLYVNGQLLHFDLSNLATVNKVKSIYTALRGASELGTDDGIYWKSKFEFYDKEAFEGNTIASGDISYRIPLIAGDNIEFEILDSTQTVKINATGGGSTDTIVGTWVLKDGLTIPQEFYGRTFYFAFNTVLDNEARHYSEFYFYSDGSGICYYGDVYADEDVYESGQWSVPWNTITITEEPTDADFISWLKANATKQEENGASNGFEMPQIRFANAKYGSEFKYVTPTDPLILTVEIVGGGALQVGDKLQICTKRTYGYKKLFEGRPAPYKKQKLRMQQEYVITEEDLGKRFLTISTAKNNSVYKWLYKNDRYGMTHTLSAFYMRIKRVSKYNDSGNECDAIFSNVVTVWKTYNGNNHTVSIK